MRCAYTWLTHALAALGLALLAQSPAAGGEAAKSVPEPRAQLQLSYAPLVKAAAPAVVNIYARRLVRSRAFFDDPFFRRFFGENSPFGAPRERVENSLGSGVIVSADGLVVTNHHVIDSADEIIVALADRREFEATIVTDDPRTDLAVLRLDGEVAALPHLELMDSDDLEVGDIVTAVQGREVTDPKALQFRIATRPLGASVDISYLREGRAGEGRAGEARAALRARPEDPPRNTTALTGEHPLAGGIVANLSPALADELGISTMARGVIVVEVSARSPAHRLRLRPHDVVARVNGHDIGRVADLVEALERPSRNWRIAVRRGERLIEVTVRG